MTRITEKNAKLGTPVRYQKAHRRGVNNYPWVESRIKKTTAEGMIRLEDGTLWYPSGNGRGEFKGSYLESWTPEDQLRKAVWEGRNYITGFVGSKLGKLSPESVLKLLAAIKDIEADERVSINEISQLADTAKEGTPDGI